MANVSFGLFGPSGKPTEGCCYPCPPAFIKWRIEFAFNQRLEKNALLLSDLLPQRIARPEGVG